MGALPKTETITSWSPSMVFIAGCITVPAGTTLTTVNLQINPSYINGQPPMPGASNLQPFSSLYPQNMRGAVFLNPNGSVAGAGTNSSTLPRGMAAGATGTLGSELLLDLSAFNADIIQADAMWRNNTRGAQGKTVNVSAVDSVNKLVYLQVQTSAGAASSLSVGDTVSFQIVLKDAAV